jgi:hypothetical protein
MRPYGIKEFADAAINSLNRLRSGFHHAGMSHHVWVGVVDDHERVFTLLDRSNTAFGESVR